MKVTLGAFVALLLCAFQNAGADPNYRKCTQVETYGYSYDSMFKLQSGENGTEIHFFVKTKSDAHILLASSMDILDQLYFSITARQQKVIEVLIGGGRNTFSSIRTGLKDSKISRLQVPTPDILSPDEFRGFWIKLSATGFVKVGLENSTEPFMGVNPFPSSATPFQAAYFGLSSWNFVKGQWKLNCPDEKHTEISGMDDIVPKGLAKLQWDITGLYDPNLMPEPKTIHDDTVVIDTALQIHHLGLNEHESEFNMGGKMFLSWYDARLRWDPAEYDNISSFTAHSAEVWTPAIMLLTSKTGSQPILTDVNAVGVFIQSNGSVQWSPMFRLSAFTGEMVIDNWPQNEFRFFVHLQCGVIGDLFFGGIETSKVQLKAAQPERWEILEVRSEWKVANITTEEATKTVEDIAFLNRMLFIDVDIKRDSSSYKAIYVTPFAALATMTLSSFWLKPHQGAKLYVHCISLVVLSCYIITLAERIPAHTAKVPTIFNAYTTSLMLSCVSIINYVCAKNLQYCTWSIPHHSRLILTHPFMENVLHIRDTSENCDGEASLESRDWNLINIMMDRILFFAFLTIYLCLYIGAK